MDKLKEDILKNYPRLREKDVFQFACHKGVSCFNDCCGDVNIFLTPYDIICLKNHLGITSTEFIEKYTVSPFGEKQKYPVRLLKMTETEDKECPFVTDEGCSVYSDRPWSCRMYPLGLASPKEGSPDSEDFFFLMKEQVCKGFEEDHEQTIEEWLEEQGINAYNEMGKLYKEVTLHEFFEEDKELTPPKMEMFHLVCYDIDKFRTFVFESSFLEKFEVDADTIDKMKDSDVELFKFGVEWLKFALFGEKTMQVKDDVRAAKEREIQNRMTPRG
jgi:hypothetical protein